MTAYTEIQARLIAEPKTWLVTGVAGFIGSNLLETLLKLNQRVTGLDNFSTGHQHNIDEVQSVVTPGQWANFRFMEANIRNLADCHKACQGVDYVLHQAALGSVPRSIADPITTNANNIDGFLNMLVAARDASVQRFVYAASSSTYGDHPAFLSALVNSEVRDDSEISFSEFDQQRYRDFSGSDIPEQITSKWGMDWKNVEDWSV